MAWVGKYGGLRETYLREHHHGIYNAMFIKGTLQKHLEEVQEQATNRIDTLMQQMIQRDPPPDKATHPMEWVGYMNMTKAMAEEIVYNELIYV